MMMLGTYRITEKIAVERERVLYRAIDPVSNERLLIKVYQDESRFALGTFMLKNEFDLLSVIGIPNCVHAIRIENIEGCPALIMEDMGGVPLRQYVSTHQLDLVQKIKLAIKISDAISNMHRKGIIHKNINPSSVMVMTESGEILLSEFDYAEKIGGHRESSFVGMGLPEYISPEQTGRTSRAIDYRSDIYSLGIILYELFCSRLPFEAVDINGHFFAHMTMVPPAPISLKVEIPLSLNSIIMKMIEKEPETRYKSALGLLADLEWVLKLMNGEVQSDSFELGKADVSMRFSMPAKLYGKTTLLDSIEDIKSRAQNGENRIVLLQGESGTGKTHLLKELFRRWMDGTGTVILIDLSDMENLMPYHAVRLVLDRFLRLIQNGEADKRKAFIEKVTAAIGPNMSLLVDLFPNLNKLIPSRNDEHPAEQFEHKPLIDQLLINLAENLLAYDPPFIVLINDISKIDRESAQLLKNLLQQRITRSFMVIGTDVPANAAIIELNRIVENAKSHCTLNVLAVHGFSLEDIHKIIRDSFGIPSKKANFLSRLIFSKTNGNPFYSLSFIRMCCEENWIFFNEDFGGWDFKAVEIQRIQAMPNVAEQALQKFNDLDPAEIDILKIAAGMGFEFSLENLSWIANVNSILLSERLSKALEYSLIAGRISSPDLFDGDKAEWVSFRFSHDSIYKRLIEMTEESGRMEISYAYGHLLKEKNSVAMEELDQALHHLNTAAPLIRITDEKRELACMNLEYGVRLKRIGVFDKALEHIQKGLELIDGENINVVDSVDFRLNLERAELTYLNKQFDEAEAYFDELIQNCSTPINHAKAIRIKMILYVNQGRMKETVELAEQALKVLGATFDSSPDSITVVRELLLYNIRVFGKKNQDIEMLPVSTNTEIILITQIYMTLISVSYLVGKKLFIYVILRILNINLKHGLTVHSSYAFSIYGLIAGSAMSNPVKGVEYGNLGIRLAQRFGNQDMLAKCHFTYGFFLNHWIYPTSGNLPHLIKAIELSYQTGDRIFYSYSVAAYILSLLDAGTPVNIVLNSVDRYFDQVQDKQVDDIFNLLVLLRQVIFALQGETDSPCSLDSIDFDEAGFKEKLKASSMPTIHAVYLVQKLKLLYLYGKYEQANRICKELKGYTQELIGLSVYPEYYQYYSLTLLELEKGVDDSSRIIASNQKKLAGWIRYAPLNFQHRFLLVQGICHQKRGQSAKAVQYLSEALQIAQKQGFLQDEALITELLGRCYENTNQAMIRRMYLKNAYILYKHWGASAKETDLKERYCDISFEVPDDCRLPWGRPSWGGAGDKLSEQVDLLSVFKSAQTLSSETEPEILLKRLLEIISENAGSQKTIILMKKENLIPIAWSKAEGVTVLKEGESWTCDYPETVISHAARKKEAVLIEDVSKAGVYRKDPYVVRNNPVSLMCIPILWKGNLTGILYLENNRISGAFNRGRLEVMQVLTAQFVISYENALLYEDLRESEAELKTHKYKLERLVEDRTSELTRVNFEIQTLLDHAGQGFFSFDPSGRIGTELSRECYRIFKKNIAGELVSELLGSCCDAEETILISRIIGKAFNAADAFESNVYLSLLPQTVRIRDRIISIEYQMINDSDSPRVMAILTDVTERHALILVRDEEKRNLKMIVRVVKNRNSFLRSIEDYEAFTQDGCRKLLEQERNPDDILTELFRMVHTFKGDFAQWGFSNTESALHEIESLIVSQRNQGEAAVNVTDFIEELDFEKAIEKDLMILENAIGKSFLKGDEYYEISRSEIVSLEELYETEDYETLGSRIKELRLVNLKDLIIPYDDYVATLAFGLDKKTHPLRVVAEDLRIDRKHYYNLSKVLTHIFRNMLDYGIEDPETRMRLSKAEFGTIICRIRRTSDSMMAIELEDDGSGIDRNELLNVLLQRDPEKRELYLKLPGDELMQLIFSDAISTSGDITMLSGRGIGLFAVREEVEKLDGMITVFSTPGVGTRFVIDLPIIV